MRETDVWRKQFSTAGDPRRQNQTQTWGGMLGIESG